MHGALTTVSGMWGFEGKTMVAAVDYQLLTELTNLLQVIVLIITTDLAPLLTHAGPGLILTRTCVDHEDC